MKKYIYLVGLLVFVGALVYTFLLINNSPKNSITTNSPKTEDFFSQLDGLPAANAVSTTPAVVAVMIDNHPDARPQYGIADAAVVYEVPVEGDFTRLLAIFDRDQVVAKVGPVRSARSYYLDWQAEYGQPLYLHCGGSPEALARIKTENIFAANEFYFGRYYWRDDNFIAPHNLFTNSENWQKLWQDYDKVGTRAWQGWTFGWDFSTSTSASSFVVDYGMGYKVEWRFDAATSKYARYLSNAKQFAGGGEEIVVDNVIVQYTKTKIVDDYGRKEIQSIGNGSARVFRDGRLIVASWTKNSLTERTKFFDEAGVEIKLKPGKTWLQIVPSEGSVTVSS